MISQDLKEHIYTEQKIDFILENIGCHSIKFHPENDTWTAAHVDGDNPAGVVIKNCTYLNYYSYSRGVHIENGKDLFSLVQETKKITFAETMKYIHGLLGLKYTFKKEEPKKEEEKYDPLAIFKRAASKKKCRNVLDCTFEVLDESVLTDLVPMIHIDIYKEGITPRTIKKFGLCYSYRWRRTVFPIRWWLTGELLAYNARTSIENYDMFDIPKYWLTPGYQKQNNLYGLWENLKDIERAKYITLLESEKNVCKRDSRFDSTCVALQGHSISDEQVRIILGIDGLQEVVIAMDNDIAIEEIRYMCERFYHLRKVSYIYDRWGLLPKNKMSPADACNKVYDFLFKRRIVYNEKEHQLYLKGLEKK